ncbi:MAG: S-adenosyl-methyltransferase [Candidatus Parcubacteria bacterium]
MVHQPVLLHEVVDLLDVKPQDVVVDATLGGAGHAKALFSKLQKGGIAIGFDMDADAIERAEEALKDIVATTHLIQSNFREVGSALVARGITGIDKALFDLGWSSFQLQVGRGFSFLKDEPLLMTYAKHPEGILTAHVIVNKWEESSLADIIYGWGGERYSRMIAKAIVERRERKPIETSLELAEIVRDAVPLGYRRGRLHPATRTFQALRIAVNDELGAVSQGLKAAWGLLRPKGRIAVITFHSLEDRVVKELFRSFVKTGEGTLVIKKPLAPTREEMQANPRSRSAKLRVIEKI